MALSCSSSVLSRFWERAVDQMWGSVVARQTKWPMHDSKECCWIFNCQNLQHKLCEKEVTCNTFETVCPNACREMFNAHVRLRWSRWGIFYFLLQTRKTPCVTIPVVCSLMKRRRVKHKSVINSNDNCHPPQNLLKMHRRKQPSPQTHIYDWEGNNRNGINGYCSK